MHTRWPTARNTHPAVSKFGLTSQQLDHALATQDDGRTTNNKKKNNAKKKKKLGSTKTQGDKPVLWVDLFRCFLCGVEGRSPPLQKCSQCEVAYYCGKTCQQAHWKTHKPVCIAAVAAKAEDATRQRLARAVREKGKDKVEGGEDDALCVICFGPPVDAVMVRANFLLRVGVLCCCACVKCVCARTRARSCVRVFVCVCTCEHVSVYV